MTRHCGFYGACMNCESGVCTSPVNAYISQYAHKLNSECTMQLIASVLF